MLLNDHASGFETLAPHLSALEAHFDVARPDSSGAMTQAAADASAAGVPVVVAGGGDGSVHDVLSGLRAGSGETGSSSVLGVLPLGTGNDFARTLGLPLETGEAVQALVALAENLGRQSSDRTHALDLIAVQTPSGERVGINVLNFGVAHRIGEAIDGSLKKTLGPLAYLVGSAKAASDAQWVIELGFDEGAEERFEVAALTVLNGRFAGGGFELATTADAEDGLLDVLVVNATSMASLARIAGEARLGQLVDHPEIERRAVRSLRVRVIGEPLGATLDGETIAEAAEFSVRVLAQAQPVWVGPNYQRSPFG